MNYRKFIMEIVENIIMSITIEVSIIRKVVNSSLRAYFICLFYASLQCTLRLPPLDRNIAS